MRKPKNPLTVDAQGYQIEPAGDGITWIVTSPEGVSYNVDPDDAFCSCPGARDGRKVCKHIRALWAMFRLAPCLRAINGTKEVSHV